MAKFILKENGQDLEVDEFWFEDNDFHVKTADGKYWIYKNCSLDKHHLDILKGAENAERVTLIKRID